MALNSHDVVRCEAEYCRALDMDCGQEAKEHQLRRNEDIGDLCGLLALTGKGSIESVTVDMTDKPFPVFFRGLYYYPYYRTWRFVHTSWFPCS